MAVKILPRYLMNVAELIAVSWQLILLLRDIEFADTHHKELIGLLEVDTKKAEDAFGKDDTSTEAEKKRTADALRDETCTQMAGFLRGIQCHHKSQIRDAANYLYDLMSRHDFGGRKKSYSEQTAILRAMISDLKSEQSQTALTTSDAMPFFEELCERQDAFEAVVLEQVNAAGDPDEPSVNSLIEPVRVGILETLNHIGSCQRLHQEQYTPLVNKINDIVSDIATRVHTRKNSKKADSAAKKLANAVA
jgi:hypothetical protein